MLVNLSAVTLFALAWWLRGGAAAAPGGVVLALELAGAGLLGAGGWMGGTLAYRNQIGVDHRYAEAGKWREARASTENGEAVVAESGELEVNQMKLVRVDGRRIVLARTVKGYVAFDDHCTHRGGSLAGGMMICGTVQCPWHGSQFDAATGEVRAGPAKRGIATYEVEVTGKEIRVRL
jgi:nitrite reductase/ring-hydroxylating ferredoxin subunit